jgi:hypothetical protein
MLISPPAGFRSHEMAHLYSRSSASWVAYAAHRRTRLLGFTRHRACCAGGPQRTRRIILGVWYSSCRTIAFTRSIPFKANTNTAASSPTDSCGGSKQGIVHQNLGRNARGLVDQSSTKCNTCDVRCSRRCMPRLSEDGLVANWRYGDLTPTSSRTTCP